MRTDLTTLLVTDAPDHGHPTAQTRAGDPPLGPGKQTRFKGSSQRCRVGGSLGAW